LFQSASVDKIGCLKKGEREKTRKFKKIYFLSPKKTPNTQKNSKLDLFLEDDDISNIKHN
jgi:hypothetical protein